LTHVTLLNFASNFLVKGIDFLFFLSVEYI
jgi:hypothetical protein